MKSFKQFTYISTLASIIFLSSPSFAASLSGFQVIKSIQINVGKIFIYGEDGDWNTNDCTNSQYLVLDTTHKYYSEMYALVVASYLQGKPIESYSSTCIDLYSETRPLVSVITSGF